MRSFLSHSARPPHRTIAGPSCLLTRRHCAPDRHRRKRGKGASHYTAGLCTAPTGPGNIRGNTLQSIQLSNHDAVHPIVIQNATEC